MMPPQTSQDNANNIIYFSSLLFEKKYITELAK